MLDLWLVRHAESEGNRSGTEADTPLTAAGRAQAAALAATLASEYFDQVFSSDLLRCQETARLALPGVAVRLDPRLRELVTGPEARFVDVTRMTREQLLELTSRPITPSESGLAFRERVLAWLAELPRDGRVLAFTHTQVIRELRRHVRPGAPVVEIRHASVTPLKLGQ